jgi:hypothetical protein
LFASTGQQVLYRTLEVLGTYLSHPMVRRLADIEQCQTQAENVLEQLGLDNKKIKARLLLAGLKFWKYLNQCYRRKYSKVW